MQRIIRRAIYLIGIAILLILPLIIDSNYMLGIINLGLIMAIATLGLNISKGYLGLFNVAHAGVWGLGAYTAALLATKAGWPFLLTIPAAVVVSSLAGLFLGLVALKLRGIYFTVLTIGFTLMVQLIASNWDSFTNGANGVGSIPLPDFGFFKVTNRQQLYFSLLAFTALVIWFSVRISKNKYGRSMRAIQSHEVATELMGVNSYYEKTLGLCIGSGIGGLSGALLAHAYGYIAPVQFGFDQSVLFVVSLVAGGLGSVPGAVLGALFFTFLPEFMRPLRFWSTTIYGALVTLVILFLPEGLISLTRRIPFIAWLSSPVNPEKELENSSSLASIPIHNKFVQESTEPVLQVKDVGIRFGGLSALNHIDIELLPGQVHALIGPNGAGKSTFVNCITGAYKPNQGSVLLSGTSILGLKPYQISRLGVSRTFQNLALWKELSVLDNLLVAKRGAQTQGFWSVIFGTKGARLEDANARSEARDYLSAMGLWSERDRQIGNLPYGHQKMFEIIRALMTHPKVLLLDEPAAGLTLPEVTQLKQLIHTIKNQGVAVLLIEHNMQLVMDIADTITVLNYGQIIASGIPQLVRNNPEVVKAYLGAEDLISQKREVRSHV